MNRLFLVACLFLSSACMSADLEVERALAAPLREVSLNVQPGDAMTPEQQSHLTTVLTASLSKAGVTVRPQSAGVSELRGEVQRYSKGNQTLRWFFGIFGAGHAHFESNWSVRDGAGQEVGACRVDGSLKVGGFGGKYDELLREAGQRLNEFLAGSK